MPRRYIVYYLNICGGLTCLGYERVLVMPALFVKSRKKVYRLPLGYCSLCQYLLGGFNPGA